jgi:hypothetical protein
VVFQDRIADGDTFVADTDAVGTLRWIRDQGVDLVLRFAAKRTSDFILFVALAEHDPSMPRDRRKSRFAKVEVGAANQAKASVSTEHRKMLRLEAKRLLAFRKHFRQIKLRQHGFAPILVRFRSPRAAPVLSLTIQRRHLVTG